MYSTTTIQQMYLARNQVEDNDGVMQPMYVAVDGYIMDDMLIHNLKTYNQFDRFMAKLKVRYPEPHAILYDDSICEDEIAEDRMVISILNELDAEDNDVKVLRNEVGEVQGVVLS